MCSESNDAPAPVGVEKEADVLRLSGDLDAFALAIFRQSGVLAPAPHLFFCTIHFPPPAARRHSGLSSFSPSATAPPQPLGFVGSSPLHTTAIFSSSGELALHHLLRLRRASPSPTWLDRSCYRQLP